MDDLGFENKINDFKGRSQLVVFWNFLSVLLKLRARTIAFWIFIALSLAWIYIIRLFDNNLKFVVLPYNKATFEQMSIPDPKDVFFIMMNNSFGMIPKNNYTQYLAEQYLTYPINRTINYFKDLSEMNQFHKNKKDGYLSFVLPNNIQNNLKKLAIQLRMDSMGFFSANTLGAMIMDGTLKYMGNDIIINADFSNISQTGKIENFMESGYASLLGLSIVCLILRSALQIIELREFKIFLLLTISGARERVLWLALFVLDFVIMIPHSIIIAIMINQCSRAHGTSPTLVFVYSLLNNLAVYFFLIFIVSLTPRTTYSK